MRSRVKAVMVRVRGSEETGGSRDHRLPWCGEQVTTGALGQDERLEVTGAGPLPLSPTSQKRAMGAPGCLPGREF